MEWNKIGVVTKPQALKGQFRVKPSLLNLKLYKKMTAVKIEETVFSVEGVTIRDTFVIFKLQGIDTCESAEKLRNKDIFAEIEVDVEDHFDLVNFAVMIDDNNIGVVSSIDNFGSKDILSIRGDKNIMFPIIDNLIINVDENTKVITLNKEIFEQVAVYED